MNDLNSKSELWAFLKTLTNYPRIPWVGSTKKDILCELRYILSPAV